MPWTWKTGFAADVANNKAAYGDQQATAPWRIVSECLPAADAVHHTTCTNLTGVAAVERFVALKGFPGMDVRFIFSLVDFFGNTIHGSDLQLIVKPWDSTSEVEVAGNQKFRLESTWPG